MPRVSLDLTGKWQFRAYPLSARRMRDLDSGDWLSTTVPCSIFNSLITAGQINRQDIDTYPDKFSWVSEKPWVYKKVFDVPGQLLECDRINLIFEGLDTVANIWLNDKLIARTNNMFVPFRFDVKPLLKAAGNSLLVKFEPPVQYAKRLMNRYTSFSEADFRNPYRVYIRKAQYQFGWDFCPSLPGCGIWKPVRLEGIKEAAIEDVHVRTVDCNRRHADINVAVKLDRPASQELTCSVVLSCDDHKVEQMLAFGPGEDFQSRIIRVENPHLWWPAGYGRPDLYRTDVQLLSEGKAIDQVHKKFGMRIVKLNRHSDDHKESFQFEVNDQPVYVRGANWAPVSIFAGSVGREDYERLVGAAAQANINMLRVWGGGYYESDEFYSLCDQLGIMVWQDFMFAAGYYPDREWFVEQVEEEAVANLKRLRSHPCLALWCGNTEIDSMHNAGKPGKSKKFYGRTIYHKLLPRLVSELDPGAAYVPTTPLRKKTRSKLNPQLTTHEFSVWSEHQPVRSYLCQAQDIPQFVTEFGMQSLPDIETVKTFCPPEHMHIGDRIIEDHNYQLDGNSRMYRYVGDLFGSAANIEQFGYFSQIAQARAAKMYVEHLRAHNHSNHGVLFRRLNGCCPGMDFSAIDYMKRPKALYYYAKRFFSDLLIAVVPTLEQVKADSCPAIKSLNIVAVNDSINPITATLNCRLMDLFGSIIDKVAFPVVIGPFSSSPPFKLPKTFARPDDPERSCLHLVMETDGEALVENTFFYLPDKHIEWPEVEVSALLSAVGEKRWKLKLKANAIAKDVQINSSVPVRYSDNFVDLLCENEVELTIDSLQAADSLESALKLRWVQMASLSKSPRTDPVVVLLAPHPPRRRLC